MNRKDFGYLLTLLVCTAASLLCILIFHLEINAFVYFIPFYGFLLTCIITIFASKKIREWWYSKPTFLRKEIQKYILIGLKRSFKDHEIKLIEHSFITKKNISISIDSKNIGINLELPLKLKYLDEINEREKLSLLPTLVNYINTYFKEIKNGQ